MFSVAAALVGSAAGWVTIAQESNGAQYGMIARAMNGTWTPAEAANTPSIQLFGRIWHMPESDEDMAGLGGGIAYAWDPTLCDNIMPKFRESLFFYDKFIDCGQIKQTFARALQAWSRNHRYIKFVDVTAECEKHYSLAPRFVTFDSPRAVECPLVEMWVTHVGAEEALNDLGINKTTTGDDSAGGFPVALAEGHDNYARFRPHGGGFRMTNGVELPDTTVERYGANLKFGVGGDVCWYLDSSFCARFHEWKQYAASSSEVVMVLNLACWVLVIFGLVTCGIFKCRILGSCHRASKRKQRGTKSCSIRKRCFHMYEEAAEWSVIWTTIQCLMITLPFPIFNEIFMPCFDCFDFEAAAVHEVGHVLGLSHPNLARQYQRTSTFTPGDNVYSDVLRVNRSDTHACANPWEYVHNNTRPDDMIAKHGCRVGETTSLSPGCVGIRPSIMESFTQFNPNICLSVDDLEGIQTIYPDCEQQITEPICYRIYLNLGLVRMAVYILFPMIIVFIILLMLQSVLQAHNRQELLDTRQDLKDAAKSNVMAKFKMAKVAAKEETRKNKADLLARKMSCKAAMASSV